MTTTDQPEVADTPIPQERDGTPGLVAPILFGLIGAWWASSKASKLGVVNTKRYWVAAAISTGVAVVASILVPMLLLAALTASIGRSGTENIFDDPAVRAPLSGNATQAPVAPGVPKSFVASPADANVALVDRLETADGLPSANPTAASATDRIDTILSGFNDAWKSSCSGSNNLPEPRYLWSFVQEPKGHFYTEWGINQPTVCGSLMLVNEPSVTADPQAAAGVTSRWYQVKTSLQNSSQQGAELPMLIRFVENRWMLVGLSPLGRSLDTLETGQSVTDEPATVIARMSALRQQAFVQRSDDLLTVYYNGFNRDQPDINDPDQALIKAGIVPSITIDKVSSDNATRQIKIESTERQGNIAAQRSATYTWYREAPSGISGIWAG